MHTPFWWATMVFCLPRSEPDCFHTVVPPRYKIFHSQYHSPGARASYSAGKLFVGIWGPGASDGSDMLPKPKWMRWKTYERLSKRLEKYSSEAGVLPRERFCSTATWWSPAS